MHELNNPGSSPLMCLRWSTTTTPREVLDRLVNIGYSLRMPRPTSFDEDAVLDQAVQLFWERGYEGTSLADLETHIGLGRQSLYNAFGDKQTLFLKALERYQRAVMEKVLAHLNASGAGLDAIRAFFKAT